MNEPIRKEDAINAIAEHLGIPASTWRPIAEGWLKNVPVMVPSFSAAMSNAAQGGGRMGVLDFKQAVLDELWAAFVNRPLDSDRWVIEDIRQRVERLPVSEQEEFEWCTDCKEYDPEKHCCHRFTKVIRRTVEEMEIVRCGECRYMMPDGHCSQFADSTIRPSTGDYCSYGKKRGGVSK